MINQNKKGQNNLPAIIIGGFFLIVFVILAILTVFNYNSSQGFSSAFNSAMEETVSVIPSFFTPIFKLMLGLKENNTAQNSIMIISFILVFMVIFGISSSVSIFGENTSGKLITFVLSLMITTLGVRFMPDNLWAALTAPSSAFVATILVGIPFALVLAVGVLSSSRNAWFSKILWIFYIVFMSVLIFYEYGRVSTQFAVIYVIFLIAAVAMSIWDGTIRGWIRVEREKIKTDGLLSDAALREKLKIDLRLNELMTLKAAAQNPAETAALNKQIDNLRKKLRDLYKN